MKMYSSVRNKKNSLERDFPLFFKKNFTRTGKINKSYNLRLFNKYQVILENQ